MTNLRKMEEVMKSLRLKIFMGTISILILVPIINIYTYIKVSDFHSYTETIVNHELFMLVNNEKLSQNVSQRTAAVRGYILYHDPAYKEQFSSLSKESNSLLKQLSESLI
jgi:methyl-accepting chemotaxis protein